MSNNLLTDEEKQKLAIGSLAVGILFGCIASFIALGVSLIVMRVGQAIGVAIVSFLPVAWMSARWNVRLFIAKKKSELDKEATS